MGAAIKIFVAASTIAAAQRMTFKDFEVKFEKNFGFERGNRERIFNENLKYMQELSSDESNSIQLDIGPFADRSFEEFEEYVNLGLKPPGDESQLYGMPHLGTITGDEHVAAPESIDWVEKGAVTRVKNQGACGSCWSYSATGALEGGFFLETSFLVELSQQFLLDCDTDNSRCRGGWMNIAYKYVRDHGICTEYSYPYHCKSSSSSECERSSCRKGIRDCRVAIPPKAVAGYVTVQKRSTRALEIAVMRGPVSVAVNAGTQVFQHYSSGVVTDPYCGAQLNHAVLAVGFGVEGRVKYWLVKNSWGEHWGADGYIKVGRGVAAYQGGECGILLAGSFPVLGFGHSVPNLQPPEPTPSYTQPESYGFGKPGPELHGYGKPGPELHGYGKPGPELHGYGKPGPELHGYGKPGPELHGYGKPGPELHGYGKPGHESHGYGKPGYESHGYGKPGYESHGYGKPGPESHGYGKPGPESHYGYDKYKEPPHMRDPFF